MGLGMKAGLLGIVAKGGSCGVLGLDFVKDLLGDRGFLNCGLVSLRSWPGRLFMELSV